VRELAPIIAGAKGKRVEQHAAQQVYME
jgi:hypothetical protein